MNQGKSLITFVMVALAATLTIYMGYYVVDTFSDPFSSVLAYSYTAYDSVEADGILVREEQVLSDQSGIVEVLRREGEKVGVNQLVARVYRDSQAQNDYAHLNQLEQEIELLQSVAGEGVGVESAARLDEDILQSVVQLRAAVAQDDYSQLEDQVQQIKSGVLKRGYTYGDGVTIADLTSRLRELTEEYRLQNQHFSGSANQVRTRHAGIFSNLVDGFETLLTPDTIFSLTSSQLEQMLTSASSLPASSSVGKIITSNRWYFVSNIDPETAARLKPIVQDKKKTITVRFSGDFNQDVSMRVEQISPEENGACLVIFSSDRYLSKTTLLRRQTAEIIFASYSGLRVPKEALRMVITTYMDEETGQEQERKRLGVYTLVAGRTEFKETTVVLEGQDYYVLQSAATGSRAFRAGDEVIVRAVGLQDGLLLVS